MIRCGHARAGGEGLDTVGSRPSVLAWKAEAGFMREGCSVSDFNNPSKTIVGALDEKSIDAVLSLYNHLPGAKIRTDIETAELAKYVDNTWHAPKVVFTNEIASSRAHWESTVMR